MEKKRYCNHHEETRPKYFYYHLPFNRVIEKMIISIQEYSIYSTMLHYLIVRASEFKKIVFHKNEIQNV